MSEAGEAKTRMADDSRLRAADTVTEPPLGKGQTGRP